MERDNQVMAMRHSLAHIMASAIIKLYPETRFGIGPAIENGFYYDIDLGEEMISEEDFPKITAEMNKIIKEDQKFERFTLSVADAKEWAKKSGQSYKLELLEDLDKHGTTMASELDALELGVSTDRAKKVEKVSFYRNGNFTDLCRGPHVSSTGKVGSFQLIRVSGAYWRGKSDNPQMQRIYGVAFSDPKQLRKYLADVELAKQYDHRKLGKQLDLFTFSELVGSGLPLFTPRGTILREELNKYSQELRERIGYQKVWVPHIAKQALYETSGHWAKFGDEWLTVNSKETSDNLVMKPMNCPHHQQIYASQPRSYKDLPIKYMETTTVYRDEKAGELLGLSRVRAVTQDDSHIFCTPDQITETLTNLVDVVKAFYKTLDIKLKVRLSFRDESDRYLGDKKLWDRAEAIIQKVVEESGFEYYLGRGEAAFYGPKIDFMSSDILGRQLQLATPQLDFIQPERFGLKYIDEDDQQQTPVMIHFALMGSIERFLAAYIEHTHGQFPVWLAPEQLRVLTLNQTSEVVDFAQGIVHQASKLNIRASLDDSNETVSKKIRNSEVMKVPYVIVIGPKEMESSTFKPRIRADLSNNKDISCSLDEFLQAIRSESDNRNLTTTLR